MFWPMWLRQPKFVSAPESLLLHFVTIGLELLTEGLELAAARRICVALTAWQFSLSGEFGFRIRRCHADKGGSRTQQCCCANSDCYAACCSANAVRRAADFQVKHKTPLLFGHQRLALSRWRTSDFERQRLR